MDFFNYRKGKLFCEDVPAEKIAAEVGTPVYVYSKKTFLHHFKVLDKAFSSIDRLICYSIKSNSNLEVLRALREAGSGFDVVSGGELFRALKAGAKGSQCVYAGVGKTAEEIRFAIESGILMFNVESEEELAVISAIAKRMGKVAPVALRVNPDVDPKTHTYITTGKKENKFGIDLDTASRIVLGLGKYPGVEMRGIHMHIGSQITTTEPYGEALDKVLAFVKAHERVQAPFQYINTGGGFGIIYDTEDAKEAADFAKVIVPRVKATGRSLLMEPGRFICGNSGILLAEVLYRKKAGNKSFVIVDAAMNDLIRPSLYGSYHLIWPAKTTCPPARRGEAAPSKDLLPSDVVGGVCESGDFFCKDRPLPAMEQGDLVSIFSAGAYGHTMSSNYNSRRRAAEVLVDGGKYIVARRRETWDDLIACEVGIKGGKAAKKVSAKPAAKKSKPVKKAAKKVSAKR